tara:strand:+ start:56 stop:469 length:414 start_codon:yes stop_codon:yes gene_type:complete
MTASDSPQVPTPAPDDFRWKEIPVFHCTRCGNCCKWPGTVKLSDQEMEAIAAFLGIEVQTLIDDYMALAPDRRKLTLIEREDGACIFLDQDDRCKIQPVKPQQCKDFPHKWNFEGWEQECPAIKMTSRIIWLNEVSD